MGWASLDFAKVGAPGSRLCCNCLAVALLSIPGFDDDNYHSHRHYDHHDLIMIMRVAVQAPGLVATPSLPALVIIIIVNNL